MELKSKGEFLRNAPPVAVMRTKRMEKRENVNCASLLRVNEGSVNSNERMEMVQERDLVLQARRRRAGERREIRAVANSYSHNSSNVARQMSVHALEHGLRWHGVDYGRVTNAFSTCAVETVREGVAWSSVTLQWI